MDTTTKEESMYTKQGEVRAISRTAGVGEVAAQALLELWIKASNLPERLGIKDSLAAELQAMCDRVRQVNADLDVLAVVSDPTEYRAELHRLANKGQELPEQKVFQVCARCGHRPDGETPPPECEQCDGRSFEACESDEDAESFAENARDALPSLKAVS